jgi:hypothetical protein
MAQKIHLEPIKYVIGTDISEERYNASILAIADWFVETRKTTEPAALAKQLFKECLDGVTKDGQKWFAAATATLAARVRMKCRFDIEAMKPLRTGSEKTRTKKAKEKVRAEKKRKAAQDDKLIPPELRRDLDRSAQYGDDPSMFLSSKELANWEHIKAAYVRQFPELSTVNAEAELKLLCDLHILSERYRLRLLNRKDGDNIDAPSRAAAAKELQALKTALGIHPDQLAKRANSKAETSIGSAVARLEAMGDYRQLRARFWLEELIQIFQMYQTYTADGLHYQLDEVGLFGLTKCRTCECAKCGQRNFVGIDIKEIEEHLKSKNVITPLETTDANDQSTSTA